MFRRFKNKVFNAVGVIGFGNHTSNINIVGTDGTALAFQPSISWNTKPQVGGGQAAWLEWRTQLTPLIGREAEKKILIDWANEPHALSFKVIEAPGGVGKTRLAAEVAEHLIQAQNWCGGFVSLADFECAQSLAWTGDSLLLVDYPEHSPPKLRQLIRAAKNGMQAKGQNKLRVLLLCRPQSGVISVLAEQGASSYLSAPLPLDELPQTDNQELLHQALLALAPQAKKVTPAEFQAWLAQSPLHSTALFVLALALHLSTSPSTANRFLPAADLLQALLIREKSRWHKAEEAQGLKRGSLADVVAFATLFDGLALADSIPSSLRPMAGQRRSCKTFMPH